MPLLNLESYANLSEEERLDRIGALIAKAVVLYRCDRRRADQPEPEEVGRAKRVISLADLVQDEVEKMILEYFAKVGSSTPKSLCAALNLSRRTVTRKLARLRSGGFLVTTGNTRLASYELADRQRVN